MNSIGQDIESGRPDPSSAYVVIPPDSNVKVEKASIMNNPKVWQCVSLFFFMVATGCINVRYPYAAMEWLKNSAVVLGSLDPKVWQVFNSAIIGLVTLGCEYWDKLPFTRGPGLNITTETITNIANSSVLRVSETISIIGRSTLSLVEASCLALGKASDGLGAWIDDLSHNQELSESFGRLASAVSNYVFHFVNAVTKQSLSLISNGCSVMKLSFNATARYSRQANGSASFISGLGTLALTTAVVCFTLLRSHSSFE